jgi:hypothetical protein
MSVNDVLTRKGAALVTVMALIFVTSGIVAAVYYLLHRGIEVSGLEKKYSVAREASLGGIEVFAKEIVPAAIGGRGLSTVVGSFASITNATVAASATDACFTDKLTKSTANWDSGCSKTLDAASSPDVTFLLSGAAPAQPFQVFAKIVDTIAGNSNTSGILLEGEGAASSQTGMVTAQHFPYIYTMEIQSQRQGDASQRANLEVLYAY